MKKEITTMKETFDKKANRTDKSTIHPYVQEYATLENIEKKINQENKWTDLTQNERKNRQETLKSYEKIKNESTT